MNTSSRRMQRHQSMICAICGSDFDPSLSAARPFCSERCRKIDLSRWLDESYGVPWDPSDREDELGDEIDPEEVD